MKRLQKVSSLPFATGLALALVAIVTLSGHAFGQENASRQRFDLVGVITGQAGAPLVGAFVQIEGSDWGFLTDQKGRFTIRDMDPGRTSLVVQQLGYDTLRWEGPVQAGQELRLQMTAKPILLEGLHVVTDRFTRRRNATAVAVRAYDREELATTPQQSVLDFVASRSGLSRTPCIGSFSDLCAVVRGHWVEPSVWVDEAPVFGGLHYLESISPDELYLIEVYGNGSHIRLYTNHFMERAAKNRFQPIPFIM